METKNVVITVGIAAAVGILIGTGLGWKLKPDVVKTETQIKVVEVEKQVVVEHESVRVEIVKVKDVQVVDRWHREYEQTKSPDGTVITKETEDRNIDSIVKEKENNTEVKIVEVIKEIVVEKEVNKIVTVTPVLAQWHMGLMAGVAPRLDNVALTPVMVGIEVERRILGPVWVGAWGMAGSPVTGFNVVNGTAGLKLGVEF